MSALTPVAVEGELRIRDTDLAVRLGFSQPRDIRKLIARHHGALSALGSLPTCDDVVGKGQRIQAVTLNRKQAIFVTAKSNTADATDITIEIIHRFDAYERGVPDVLTASQVGGITKAVVRSAMAEIRENLADVLSGYDPTHAVVTDFEPMLRILAGQGVLPKGRRPLVQRCSRLRVQWLLAQGRGSDIRVSRETKRFLFRVPATQQWLVAQGNALIADHKARIAGQSVMQFRLVPKLSPPESQTPA
jgi:hypothetical protein